MGAPASARRAGAAGVLAARGALGGVGGHCGSDPQMRYALDRAPYPSICRVERSELLRRAPRLNVSDHGTMSLGFDNLDQLSQFVGSATAPESIF